MYPTRPLGALSKRNIPAEYVLTTHDFFQNHQNQMKNSKIDNTN